VTPAAAAAAALQQLEQGHKAAAVSKPSNSRRKLLGADWLNQFQCINASPDSGVLNHFCFTFQQ
jgi:hypothetical protein